MKLILTMSRFSCGLGLLVLLLPCSSALALEKPLFSQEQLAQRVLYTIGEARDLASGEFLYREYHYVSMNDNHRYVVYKNAEQILIAEKRLTFDDDLVQPALQQNNYLSGELIVVEPTDDGESFAIQYQESFDDKVQQQRIADIENLVIDGGFDELIKQSWQEVAGQQKQRFDYLSPSRQRSFEFTLSEMMCEGLTLATEVRCFQIAPGAWWLRQLIDPIRVVYDVNTKRLISYKGLGNIADLSGDYMEVSIEYAFP